MTTDQSTGHKADDDAPPDRDTGCDPQLISELACRSRGVAAQAEYDKTYQDALTKAQVDYDAARKAYREARQTVGLQVQDLRHQIKHSLERVKCLIEQQRVWRCLEDAYCEVEEELEACPHATACCTGDCTFDVDDCGALSAAELAKRIAEYQHDADDAHSCFTTLVGEAASLAKRVADLKTELDAINSGLNGDPATTDLKRVYAQAKVASRHVLDVWSGFAEIQDYVDCLCTALTCWTKACEAVSVLTNAKAVTDCKDEAERARCERLRTNTVDEILARYDKLCPERDCDNEHHEPEPEPAPEPEPEPERCPVCGEPIHHHHGHPHERRSWSV